MNQTVSACFAAIAERIERGQDGESLFDLFKETQKRCAEKAASGSSEKQESFTQVQQALETWKTVWPKLGSQREFRLAVAREARLWARRFGGAHGA